MTDNAADRWSRRTPRQRCRTIAAAGRGLARDTERWIERLQSEQRTDAVESITAEIIPTAAAMRWIGRRGAATLADRRMGIWGRPPWLTGVRQTTTRVPWGTVLILGTWNYPLFLTGVQIATALAAGNTVWVKPAVGTRGLTLALADCFISAGVPPESVRVLGESVAEAHAAIDAPVQLVVLTGAADTAVEVARRCAETLTPMIAEASGCDAMLWLKSCDLARSVELLHFALTLNSGATCIGPRRIFIPRQIEAAFAKAVPARFDGEGDFIVHPAARAKVRQLLEPVSSSRFLTGQPLGPDFKTNGRMTPTIVRLDDRDDPLESADVFAPIAGWTTYDGVNAVTEPHQPMSLWFGRVGHG